MGQCFFLLAEHQKISNKPTCFPGTYFPREHTKHTLNIKFVNGYKTTREAAYPQSNLIWLSITRLSTKRFEKLCYTFSIDKAIIVSVLGKPRDGELYLELT